MIRMILDHFKLQTEKEDYSAIIEYIYKSVVFRGTNLWILVFAIFIASLGLNVNSTAVIIGAMLVSPLMGPIMGLGLSMAITDLPLLKKAGKNYLFAAGVGLFTSALYFFITPLNEAHSEILARTSPNIYDVLIAFFGGLAGMLATSSKNKGNVIPGVAIATALMPPLCTAGYGLATSQFTYFFGAFYLFLINTVFIALGAFLMTRILQIPFHKHADEQEKRKTNRIFWLIVIVTLLPSIYFGYDIVDRSRFSQNAELFVEYEAIFPNNYLLNKNIDPKSKQIILTYGGEKIEEDAIELLKGKLKKYNLDNATFEIRQGFTYLNDDGESEASTKLMLTLQDKNKEVEFLRNKLDSLTAMDQTGMQIFKELKVQYPDLRSSIVQPVVHMSDSTNKQVWVCLLDMPSALTPKEYVKMKAWLKVRMQTDSVVLNIMTPGHKNR